jgi:hypothetical protein
MAGDCCLSLAQSDAGTVAALVSTTPAVIVATLLSPCAARLAKPNALTGSVFVDEFDAG